MRLRSRQPGFSRRGISLLEVLAALAIFFFTAAAITQMVDSASQAAQRARRLTKAELLAETKIDEITAGILPLASGGGPIEEEQGWTYSVTVTPESWTSVTDASGNAITGLSSVVVTVSAGAGSQLVEYSLSRILLDPSLRLPAQQQQNGSSP